MSFIVSYNGQFQPFKLPDLSYFDKIHKVSKSLADKQVEDTDAPPFSSLLDKESKSSTNTLQSKKIKEYQKVEKSHYDNKKLYLARDIMTSSPLCLKENTTLKEILEKMKKSSYKHFPILNNEGVLTGIISDRDLLIHLHEDHTKLKAKDMMSKEVLTAIDSTRIQQIAQIMLHENIHCLPIITNQYKLVGILTQSDILNFITRLNPTEIWG